LGAGEPAEEPLGYQAHFQEGPEEGTLQGEIEIVEFLC